MNCDLKIIVNCFFKPTQQFIDFYNANKDIFILIQCGAYNKQYESDWYSEHAFNDNTGDNISYLNEKFCDVTGIYWVWKNYDKIGNPDYIGINQYRKLYNPLDVKNNYKQYDWLINGIGFFHNDNKRISLFQHFQISHFINDFIELIKYIPDTEKYNFIRYITDINLWTDKSMFVTTRENFFKLCEFCFPIALNAVKNIDTSKYDVFQKRIGGYFFELLVSYFILTQIAQNKNTFKTIGYQFYKDWQPAGIYDGLER